MLLGFYLFLVIALPLALGTLLTFNGLPRGRCCPGCAGETLRIRSRILSCLSRAVPGETLHARWCPSCDWSGTARLPRPLLSASTVPAPGPSTAPAASMGTSAGLEIRRIDLDGDAWRIRLHCWAEGGTWHGRLLFVGPGGRFWMDDRPCASGDSALQVLSQVLTFPEQTLAGRIRKVTR